MASLNDLVVLWGISNRSLESYDPSKYELIGDLSPEAVAVFDGATSFNEGLAALAQVVPVFSALLMETGDALLTESGDRLGF